MSGRSTHPRGLLHALRLLLLLLCWLPALLPHASATGMAPTTADFPRLASEFNGATHPCPSSVARRVLVRQNPWSAFDPEGLQSGLPTLPISVLPPEVGETLSDVFGEVAKFAEKIIGAPLEALPGVGSASSGLKGLGRLAKEESVLLKELKVAKELNVATKELNVATKELKVATKELNVAEDVTTKVTNPNGRNGSPAHQADVAANSAGATPPMGPKQVGNRVPDNVGQPGQPATIRGQNIEPAPSARVIVESEKTTKGGLPVSDGRRQIRDIRNTDPEATIVITDHTKPAAPPIIYPPGTQPPPGGRLPKGTPPSVPHP